MILSAQPLNFVDVNNFSVVERLDLVQGNGGTYRVKLVRREDGHDSVVRYIPPTGATCQLVFPRSLSVAAVPSSQDVTVPLVQDANDKSIYSFTLTPQNVDKIASDGAKLVITEGGVAKTYPVDHLVRRRSNAPGA